MTTIEATPGHHDERPRESPLAHWIGRCWSGSGLVVHSDLPEGYLCSRPERRKEPEEKLRRMGSVFVCISCHEIITNNQSCIIFALAVVTGATDGIGKAMAFEFAKQGMNIVLLSRSKDKLEDCQAEIKAKYPKVDVRFLPVDYSQFDEKARAKVDALLKDLDVGVLVNNVGMSYPFCQYFHELTDEVVGQLMELNVNSTTWMTRIVLPGMLARKRGAIVNISSGTIDNAFWAITSVALFQRYASSFFLF